MARGNRAAKRLVRTLIARERSGSRITKCKREALTTTVSNASIPNRANFVVIKNEAASSGVVAFNFNALPAANRWTLDPGETSPAIGLGDGVTLRMKTQSGTANVQCIFY